MTKFTSLKVWPLVPTKYLINLINNLLDATITVY